MNDSLIAYPFDHQEFSSFDNYNNYHKYIIVEKNNRYGLLENNYKTELIEILKPEYDKIWKVERSDFIFILKEKFDSSSSFESQIHILIDNELIPFSELNQFSQLEIELKQLTNKELSVSQKHQYLEWMAYKSMNINNTLILKDPQNQKYYGTNLTRLYSAKKERLILPDDLENNTYEEDKTSKKFEIESFTSNTLSIQERDILTANYGHDPGRHIYYYSYYTITRTNDTIGVLGANDVFDTKNGKLGIWNELILSELEKLDSPDINCARNGNYLTEGMEHFNLSKEGVTFYYRDISKGSLVKVFLDKQKLDELLLWKLK